MKVIYTDQSIDSLEESIQFLVLEQGLSTEQAGVLVTQLFRKADSLELNPYLGQYEESLEELGKSHRRLVEGCFKIIYKVEADHISIIDFFDTRQDPSKMKS